MTKHLTYDSLYDNALHTTRLSLRIFKHRKRTQTYLDCEGISSFQWSDKNNSQLEEQGSLWSCCQHLHVHRLESCTVAICSAMEAKLSITPGPQRGSHIRRSSVVDHRRNEDSERKRHFVGLFLLLHCCLL